MLSRVRVCRGWMRGLLLGGRSAESCPGGDEPTEAFALGHSVRGPALDSSAAEWSSIHLGEYRVVLATDLSYRGKKNRK